MTLGDISKAKKQNRAILEGWWKFEEGKGNAVADSSPNRNMLVGTGNSKWSHDNKLGNVVILDGETQWFETDRPVLKTDQSFTIAAWVRLDSSAFQGELKLKPGENALTAVSQDSTTHSGFYLGLRRFKENNLTGDSTFALNWSFTLAPFDMENNGVHARNLLSLNDAILDKWVMLVGICDIAGRSAHLYLPETDELNTAYMPDSWILWPALGRLQIGRGHWEKRKVDQWSGSIGAVRVFSGVLDLKDAKKLYNEDTQRLVTA